MMYQIRINNTIVGPMTAEQVSAYPVTLDTPVTTDGINWLPLLQYPELVALVNSSKGCHTNYNIDNELSNKKVLCGIMAILFGCLGVQYFILGKVAGGIITILLSFITCGLWTILTLIQGICMLCMTDAEFKRKFIDSTSTLPLF